ncbi:MAG: bifunctional nicotinamidase/pyrazinamidase [Melioribacter sp.]|nr:bifunctional nicotinamidase/pyrazinamidase [Melioribacter sp.]
MNTLLIVDIQNDFIPGGALSVPEGDKIIPVINRIQEKFDLVVATQDWHPKNHKSFSSNHPGKKVFDKIILNGIEQILWPDHCVQESFGAEFNNNFSTGKVEAIFRKGMETEIDSYSAFYDNGHIKSTGLSPYLKGRNVDEFFITGLAGDFCVYYSIKDALNEGFKVSVIEDAVRSIDQNNFLIIKKELKERGVKFITSNQLV